MRIALFHNAPSGGAKRAIFEWVYRLSSNHEIDVYTLSTANHDFCDIRPYVQKHTVFEFQRHNLFNSPFGRFNQVQRWRDLGNLSQLSKKIAQEIDSGSYDVLFAHTCIFTVIPVVLQYVKTPTVYYLHEPFGPAFTRHFERPYISESSIRKMADQIDPLIKLYEQRLSTIQRKSVNTTDLMISNSDFTRQYTKLIFGVDTPISHCGVSFRQFKPLPDVKKEDFIFSVGELSPRKGFDFIIKSLAHISDQQRPPLKIACNSMLAEEKEYIEFLAAKHNVRLEILNNLDADQLAIQFNKAKFCVYTPIKEPFGLVPIEAMACGTPVVGVAEGGVKESVLHEQTGLLVERDEKLFAEAIEYLLDNPETLAAYSTNAREHVLNQWTWEQSVQSLEKFLINCANNHKNHKQLLTA